MNRVIPWTSLLALLLVGCDAPQDQATEAALMTWPELTSRPLPSPTDTVRYADHPAGVVDIWLPDAPGPHPVVLMVHGGCWQKGIADRTLMNYAAEDLRRRGLAVWNIEYRGVDEEGGGYPGTFFDVAAASEAILQSADALNLDPSRIAAFGHSAGGHLVGWLTTRKNLEATSPLRRDFQIEIDAAVISGGLVDLEASSPVTLQSCLAAIEEQLVGKRTESRPDPYADTSPAHLLPPDAPQWNVHGALDRIAPPSLAKGYAEKVISAGGTAEVITIPGEGHVELIAPGTASFEAQADLLETLLKN